MSLLKKTQKSALEINPNQLIVNKNKIYIPDYMLGHEEVEWTEEDKKSLGRAKKIFEDKLKLGWVAFKEIDKKWERIEQFEPKTAKILLLPISKTFAARG